MGDELLSDWRHASSVLTLPLSWKFRLFEREKVTGNTQEQNRWLKTASGKTITINCTAPEEKKRRKVSCKMASAAGFRCDVVIRFLPLYSQNTSIERIFGALQSL